MSAKLDFVTNYYNIFFIVNLSYILIIHCKVTLSFFFNFFFQVKNHTNVLGMDVNGGLRGRTS